MTDDQKIPSKEAIRQCGISRETLLKYAKLGLVTAPVLRSYGPGNGRGRCLWWSRNVDFQVAVIKSFQNCGLKLNEISDHINGDIDYVKLHRKYQRGKNARKS